jgi:hypothetical protein
MSDVQELRELIRNFTPMAEVTLLTLPVEVLAGSVFQHRLQRSLPPLSNLPHCGKQRPFWN